MPVPHGKLISITIGFHPAYAGKSAADSPYSDTSVSATTTHLFSITNKLNVYDSLHSESDGLVEKGITMALKGMAKLVKTRHIKDNLLAIVDFSQPSVNNKGYLD